MLYYIYILFNFHYHGCTYWAAYFRDYEAYDISDYRPRLYLTQSGWGVSDSSEPNGGCYRNLLHKHRILRSFIILYKLMHSHIAIRIITSLIIAISNQNERISNQIQSSHT